MILRRLSNLFFYFALTMAVSWPSFAQSTEPSAIELARQLLTAEGRDVTTLRQALLNLPEQNLQIVAELLKLLDLNLQKRPEWGAYTEDPRDAVLMLIQRSTRGWTQADRMKNSGFIGAIKQHFENINRSVATLSARKNLLLEVAEKSLLWANEEFNELIFTEKTQTHATTSTLNPEQVREQLRTIVENSKPWLAWGAEKRDRELEEILASVKTWPSLKQPEDSITKSLLTLLEKFPRAQKRRELILQILDEGQLWTPAALQFLIAQTKKSGPQFVRPTLQVARALDPVARDPLRSALAQSQKNRAVALALLYILDIHTSAQLEEFLKLNVQGYRLLKTRAAREPLGNHDRQVAAFPAGIMSGENHAYTDLEAWTKNSTRSSDGSRDVTLESFSSEFSQTYEAMTVALTKLQDALARKNSAELKIFEALRAEAQAQDLELFDRLVNHGLTRPHLDKRLKELYLGSHSCEGQL